MPVNRVTKRLVDAMKPGDLVWDSDVRGFGIRCQEGRKVYVLKAQVNGRSRWFSIGPHGSPWSPDQARAEAQRLLGEIKAGVNVVAIREARTEAASVADLSKRYIDEHATPHKKPGGARADQRSINNHIKPLLGSMAVAEVTREDIERFKRTVQDGKAFAKVARKGRKGRLGPPLQGGPIIANRLVALLSKMFNLAEVWGWRPESSNPCRMVKRYKETSCQRFLSDVEIERLGRALDQYEQSHPGNVYAVAAIRLLLLTGARVSEILGLKWSIVDAQRALLMLPDSKTGAKVIHLGSQATSLLANLPRQEDNPFVIVGATPGCALVNLAKPWQEIRAVADIADVRLHDLRHSFASIAAANGASLIMIGKMLGHASPLTTQRYAHLVAAPLKELAEGVGNAIGKAMRKDV